MRGALIDALADAHFGTALLTSPEDLLAHEITIFRDRVRIDVQTAAPGLVFQEAWQRRAEMTYKDQVFYVVSQTRVRSYRRSRRCADPGACALTRPCLGSPGSRRLRACSAKPLSTAT